MVQFLQAADAVRGDPGEHVPPQHQAPQRPLQPGECEGRDGVEVVIADLQTPGSCRVMVVVVEVVEVEIIIFVSPISLNFPTGNFRNPFPASVRANTRVFSS